VNQRAGYGITKGEKDQGERDVEETGKKYGVKNGRI
jgi:hypothetical protein